MKVFYVGRKHRTNAWGDYNPKSGEIVVNKGSVVSETVASFRNAEYVKKLRNQYVDNNGVLIKDLLFPNPSSAVAFVAGYSADGRLAWHVEKHRTLRDEYDDH